VSAVKTSRDILLKCRGFIKANYAMTAQKNYLKKAWDREHGVVGSERDTQ